MSIEEFTKIVIYASRLGVNIAWRDKGHISYSEAIALIEDSDEGDTLTYKWL